MSLAPSTCGGGWHLAQGLWASPPHPAVAAPEPGSLGSSRRNTVLSDPHPSGHPSSGQRDGEERSWHQKRQARPSPEPFSPLLVALEALSGTWAVGAGLDHEAD